MSLTLKVTEDTILKQKPAASGEISDSQNKHRIEEGTELKIESWDKTNSSYVKVTFADASFKGKNTWYTFSDRVQIWEDDRKVLLEQKGLVLKIIEDTILKQKPISSSQIDDPEAEKSINSGTQLELQSWKKADNAHVKVAFADASFKDKNTWYAFTDHVQIWCGESKIPLEETKVVREVTSCSTAVVRELDQQILDDMNDIIPNALVSFESLDVDLGEAVWALLQPPAKEALAHAIRDRGEPFVVTSAYRTIVQQQILYNHYKDNHRCGIALAAPPPDSNHQSGLAIDTPDYQAWRPFMEKHGWRWFGPSDRVHFDYVGGGTRDLRSVAVRAFQQLWNRNNYSDQIAEDGIWGISTLRRLNKSPIKGFGKSIFNYRILRLTQPFMQGKDVRQVQEALDERGFDLKVDGIYGPSTQTTVRQFQKKNDLTIDGIAGPETISELGLYCQSK